MGWWRWVRHSEDCGVDVVEDLAIVGPRRFRSPIRSAVACARGRVGVDRGGEEGAALQFLEGSAVGLAHAAAADQADCGS